MSYRCLVTLMPLMLLMALMLHNVLWVHIQGLGGYFISYRKLEQWIAACSTLIRFCPNLQALNALWESINQEAQRYTEEAFSRLDAIFERRLAILCSSKHCSGDS